MAADGEAAPSSYSFFDESREGNVLWTRVRHRNAAPHLVVLAIIGAILAQKTLFFVLAELSFARDQGGKRVILSHLSRGS